MRPLQESSNKRNREDPKTSKHLTQFFGGLRGLCGSMMLRGFQVANNLGPEFMRLLPARLVETFRELIDGLPRNGLRVCFVDPLQSGVITMHPHHHHLGAPILRVDVLFERLQVEAPVILVRSRADERLVGR